MAQWGGGAEDLLGFVCDRVVQVVQSDEHRYHRCQQSSSWWAGLCAADELEAHLPLCGNGRTRKCSGAKGLMFRMRMSSCIHLPYTYLVGLCPLQGLHWLINNKPLTFCTADLYQHRSHIGADVRFLMLSEYCSAAPGPGCWSWAEAERDLIFVSFVIKAWKQQ